MNIKMLQLLEGARQATGVTVIIDVFRAFTVEAYAMSSGAKMIIPVGDKQVAYNLKVENPDYILIGERHGKILPGFDYGNSPSQIENVNLKDKVIIHTTSAGTQGIANAKNADMILTGSLVNARAIAEFIRQNEFKDVSLVCMGLEAIEPIEEDTLCAEYIKSLLGDKPFDLNKRIEQLKNTSGAKFFDETNQEVFPKRDFELCTDVDKFNFVLKLVHGEKFDYMEKIDVNFN